MQTILCVGAGGFLGAVARFGISHWTNRRFPEFPAGTLVVNVLGCLLIGVLMTLLTEKPDAGISPNLRLLLVTGLLGSLTTFSTFGFETIELLDAQRFRAAALYVAANLSLGLLAVVAGRFTVRLFSS